MIDPCVRGTVPKTILSSLASALIVLSTLISFYAHAATVSDMLLPGITTTVDAQCSVTALPLSFRPYSGLRSDATTTIAINCTDMTSYSVGLTAGSGTSATVTSRAMAGARAALNDRLAYALFLDQQRTANWGETPGVDTVGGTGSGKQQIITVYGRIPAGQFVTPGHYADLINVIVTY